MASALEALDGIPDDLLHGGDLKPQRDELLGPHLLSHQPRLGVLGEPATEQHHKPQACTPYPEIIAKPTERRQAFPEIAV